MSSANLDRAKLNSACLEPVRRALRSLYESTRQSEGAHLSQFVRNRQIKSYLKGESCFVLEFWRRASPSRKHYLVLHRVPLGPKNLEIVVADAGANGTQSPRGDVAPDGCSNCVFVVREPRHGANNRVPALIQVISRIWLLGSQDIPQFARDRLFSGLAAFKLPLEKVLPVNPGEVPVTARLTDGVASSKEGLVEAVLGIVDRVRNPLFDDVGSEISDDHLSDEIASLTLTLYDGGEVFGSDEGLKSILCFGASTYCPVDQFLRFLECA